MRHSVAYKARGTLKAKHYSRPPGTFFADKRGQNMTSKSYGCTEVRMKQHRIT